MLQFTSSLIIFFLLPNRCDLYYWCVS